MDRGGQIRALFARQRIRMFPLEFGNSTATVSIPLSRVEPAADALRRLLSGIGYRGVFSAEFKFDERDGLFKILEVNARPWWYVEFASNCGIDVCHMAYRDALGEPVNTVSEYRVGRKCVYPRRDLESRRAEPSESDRVSVGSLLRFWAGADQLTLCSDDPLPGATELYNWGRSRLRQALRS
jgi:predicted ATP-grasp superfamily ATP-dependent carboligase